MNKKIENISYKLLPFQFRKIKNRILLTNDSGEYFFVEERDFLLLIDGVLPKEHAIYNSLKSKSFICDEYSENILERLAAKFRTKKKFIFESTALHMLIMTHRCNQQCEYCHASSKKDTDDLSEDMSQYTARKCIEIVFESPSPSIKIEFQGGEPTLNFPVIKDTVEYAKSLNGENTKNIEFVICTNLYDINDAHIEFINKHNIHISTSIDGSEHLHNRYRKTGSGRNTFGKVIGNITKIRNHNREINISALLTVTKENINKLREVVDTYISLGFNSVFIRGLNPFGKAQSNWLDLAYSDDEFIESYFDVLAYIINLNKSGIYFTEEWAAILMTKILTPYDSGFVDIQSPAGTGISGVIYDVDGKAFISDEARMFYRTTKNSIFCLGNVNSQSRHDLMASPVLREVLTNSIIETLPGCAWCAYQPYCGSDPVRNFSQLADFISFKPNDSFCHINKRVFDYLFTMLSSEDETTLDIFWAWATGRALPDIGFSSVGSE